MTCACVLPCAVQIDLTQMLKVISYKGRLDEQERDSATTTEKTLHQRKWIPGVPGRPAIPPVPQSYTCCGYGCPDIVSCCCSSCCLNPAQPGSPAVPETPGRYEDDIQDSSTFVKKESGETLTQAGTVAFAAHLQTPVDPTPLPAPLVMGKEDVSSVDKGLIWTSSIMLFLPRSVLPLLKPHIFSLQR